MKFRHSGKLGDIVYSLAAARQFPESEFYIQADGSRLSPEAARAILPLLEYQPGIQKAGVWQGEPFEHDFDQFRGLDPVFHNLADCHLRTLGLPLIFRDSPWITVESARRFGKVEVLFARSGSFWGMPGVMGRLYQAFGNRAAFVGTVAEYRSFCEVFGPLHYVETRDLREVAEVIAGCRLFVGNQSCPLAIAEALKVPLIQEVCHSEPNCIFYREGAYPLWHVNQLPSVIQEVSARLG